MNLKRLRLLKLALPLGLMALVAACGGGGAAETQAGAAAPTEEISAANDQTAPQVTITSPSPNTMSVTRVATASLAGNVSDDRALAGVTWVNDRGAMGIAKLTYLRANTSANWAAASVPLLSGTNNITVTATDRAGNRSRRNVVVNYAPPADGGTGGGTPPPTSYSLAVALSGQGMVVSTPAGLSCATASGCSASFVAGTAVALTAAPAAGYSFTGWGGACTGTGACTVTVNSNATVSATFTPMVSLAVVVNGVGGVGSSPAGISCPSDCSELVPVGTSVTLAAVPGDGMVFSGWGGACSGNSASCTLTVSANTSVSAGFASAPVVGGTSVLLADLTPPITYRRAALACPAKDLAGNFALPSVNDAAAGAQVTSQCFTVAGIPSGQVTTFSTGAATHSVNGGAFKAAGVGSVVVNGDQIQLRTNAATTIDAEVVVPLNFDSAAGRVASDWTVRTMNSGRPARTWQVGATRSVTQLSAIASQLQAGDVVELDPGVYSPVRFTASGAANAPIVVRGVGATRPVIRGISGDAYRATVHFSGAHNMLLENVEVDGGGGTRATSTSQVCVRLMADKLVLRNVFVHDCPRHGLLGTDAYSGTVVLDRVEVARAGAPAGSGENTKHAIYGSSDRDRYPGSVLRVMHSSIHDFEGVGIKSRAERNEIYYNWIDTKDQRAALAGETQPATLYSLELVGYEIYTPEPAIDNDVVGNVLVHRDVYGIRLGGDGTGASRGRVNFVNNNVIVSSRFGSSSPVIRLFQSLDSVYLANNLFATLTTGTQPALRLFRDDITGSVSTGYGWVRGQAQVSGANNWLPAGSDIRLYAGSAVSSTPSAALTGTLSGSANPGLADLSTFNGLNVGLAASNALFSAGQALSATPPAGYLVAQRLEALGFATPATRPAAGASLSVRPRGTEASVVPVGVASPAGTVTPSLTVSRVGTGSVVSNPAGINCGSSCVVGFDSATSVTLNATPTATTSVSGWTGCDSVNGGACTVLVNGARQVSVTFSDQPAPVTPVYVLGVTIAGSGSVLSVPSGINCAVSCNGSFNGGQAVALAASPAAGWTFTGWSGACTGTGTCTVTMDAAKTVTANFALSRYTLALGVSGSGSIGGGASCAAASCSTTVAAGTVLSLSATPAAGWSFTGWGGACSGTATCSVTMDAAKSVSASFAQLTSQVLNVSVSGTGSVAVSPGGSVCASSCSSSYTSGTSVTLSATPGTGNSFTGWTGACSGMGVCTLSMTQARSVGAGFAPVTTGSFAARPYLFKADEARLRAIMAASDPEAVGPAGNTNGQPLGFLTLAQAAHANRGGYSDVPTWHIALAGWLLNNTAMMQRARDEAMAIVAAAPAGDSGRSDTFQHVEDRLLNVAAVADLAYAQFSPAQLSQVATWVNGTLNNWNLQNTTFWPMDEPLNNYWQNGFLAHVVGGIATEGFNAQAASWRSTTEAMARKWVQRTTVGWSGPVQSEGHYYAGYVNHAFWAMELYDAAMGSSFVAQSRFSPAEHLDMVMYQTRPHLRHFFEVGSEANDASASHTFLSLTYWHHMISSGRHTAQAQQAKAILNAVMPSTMWPRFSKAFANFYWSIRSVPTVTLAAKTDRLYAAPSPGAGLIGVRSAAGFQTNARAAMMFASHFGGGSAYSHANPDAPGFQWGDGADWLVADPEYFNSSGIMAEAGPTQQSNVSNMVTLQGYLSNSSGAQPQIVHAEDNSAASVPHFYTQINAQPYWNMTSTYRRDYVWLDDLRVLVVWDRIVGSPAKKWRLHAPATVTVNGNVASYTVNGKAVNVRNVLASSGGAWAVENTLNVWRLSQDDAANDYRSIKVLDVGSRVSAATLTSGAGWYQANLTIDGVARTVRFFDDGTHAVVQ